ncbi:MAG: aspartyl protease [Symploca sp. SIO2D2]|nr:aspartyl protease [Symploca sp. SIO2D2]
MIHGFFGDEDELFFEIELLATDGLELSVDAILDTGFDRLLAINKQDLDALGWVYVDQQTMRTAQGDSIFDIVLGKVRIDSNEFDIPVHVGPSFSEVLLGRQWLKTHRLMVDMSSSVLTCGRLI